MFGGGGTIAFEALNLGADTYSIDSNELSVFIQKCNLVYPQFADPSESTHLLESSGQRVLEQLAIETAPLFPLRYLKKGPSNYLWTYSRKCHSCGFRYLLSKRPWLSKKRGQHLALRLQDQTDGQAFSIDEVLQTYEHPTVWNGKTRQVICPKCKKSDGPIEIGACQDEMVALVRTERGTGKQFHAVPIDALPTDDTLRRMESRVLAELEMPLPSSAIPKWSGIANPSLYGISTHADFMNPRQRVVLLCLIKLLRDEYEAIKKSHSSQTASFVVGMLSGLVDQLVDWNCRLSMWIPQNEQVGRAFCGPGIPMLWDYAETDPVLFGPSNLWSKLKRIVQGAKSMGRFASVPHVLHAHAQSLPFENDFFDAVVTDPPYYDNVYYSLLADFFFSWKRMLLSCVDPELFKQTATDSSAELVASTFRSGSPGKAHSDYCHQFGLAIAEASRVLKPDAVFSLVYSHSSLNGWEALVRAYRPTQLRISGVLPLKVERKARPRAMNSAAINTCISFVARKSKQPKQNIDLNQLVEQFRQACVSSLASELGGEGWHEDDLALALFAQGVAVLANVDAVSDCESVSDCLIVIEKIVQERYENFRVQKRLSL